MTGTEERALVEMCRLMRSGMTESDAIKRVRSEFNLSALSVSEVLKALL